VYLGSVDPALSFVFNDLEVFAFLLLFHFLSQASLLCRDTSISIGLGKRRKNATFSSGGPQATRDLLGVTTMKKIARYEKWRCSFPVAIAAIAVL
jgi:hypothetical protein